MFAAMHSPKAAYHAVAVETGVEAANPHRLILMLFEGAMHAVSSAALHMHRGDIAAKGEAISRAINIIANGLKASLDFEAGGDGGLTIAAQFSF